MTRTTTRKMPKGPVANNTAVTAPNYRKMEVQRLKDVEKALDVLRGYGLSKAHATLGLRNTPVSFNGNSLLANLEDSEPDTILQDLFQSAYLLGFKNGSAATERAHTSALFNAFPTLRASIETMIDRAIEKERDAQ